MCSDIVRPSWRIRPVRHAIGCPANGAERHGSTGVRDAGTARFLGREADLGTVERGKLADIVVLDKSPLADTANTRAIAAVVANGRYFSRADLDGILRDVVAAARTR